MIKYKPTILLIVIIGYLVIVSGCVSSNKPVQQDSYNPTPVPTLPPTPEPKQYLEMDFKKFIDTMASYDVTILQKQNLADSSIGKYVKWKGEIVEVTQNNIQLKYIDNWHTISDLSLFVTNDQMSKLASLNKGDKITFEGLITKQSFPYAKDFGYNYGFKLFNGEIISKG